MVSPSLRAVIERGFGAGELAGDDVAAGAAEHPVCGDRIELSVQHAAGFVRAVRWRASGCPATMAIAALAAEVLSDVAVADLQAVLQRAIATHGGLKRHEHHAQAMILRALHQAIAGSGA
jgi:nitrogen fixation protein NifU and related proteins